MKEVEICVNKNNVTNCVEVYRKKKKLTQKDLAEQVGVSRQTIISIEKGNYDPSVKLALKISIVLQEDVETLFRIEK